ncbi:MAG: HAD family hydrolase [Mycoplasmatales bacterium]|nr:HAD family hydrolase [Mycoplasmatales bacterium]
MSLIFSDIDGTIYGPDHKIHPDLKPAIKEAKKASVMFNIATGNGAFKAIRDLASELGAKYLINSNGAGIVDLVSGEYIYKNMLSKDITNQALQMANELKVHANWWNDKHIYCNEYVSEEAKTLIQQAMASMGPEIIISNEVTDDMFKIEFYDYDIQKIDELEKRLKEIGLTVARMKPIHIEVTMPNVSKAHSIQIICDIHNVAIEEVMSIGDSANDETMLKIAGYSYAMANAPKVVKTWAKYHTSAYNQNGVGMAIMDYLHRSKKDR